MPPALLALTLAFAPLAQEGDAQAFTSVIDVASQSPSPTGGTRKR